MIVIIHLLGTQLFLYKTLQRNVTITFSYMLENGCGSNTSLTHWVQDKMASISEKIFATAFYWMKTFEFAQKSIEVRSLGSNFQKSIIGSDNVLFRNRWLAIMWTNDGTIHWRICVTWPKWVKWGNALDVSIFYLPVIYQVRYMTWQPLNIKIYTFCNMGISKLSIISVTYIDMKPEDPFNKKAWLYQYNNSIVIFIIEIHMLGCLH